MKDNAKRLDYITRAIRETEAPLISQQIEKDKEEAYRYIEDEYNVYKQKAENYLKNVSIWKEILPIVSPEIGNYEDIIINLRCNEIKEELENRRKEDLEAKAAEEARRKQEEEERRKEQMKQEQENKMKNAYIPPSKRGAGESSGNSFPPDRRYDRNTGSGASNMLRNSEPSKGSLLGGSSSSGAGRYVPPSRRR